MPMPSTMKLKILFAIASTALLAGVARADVIMDWNAKADAIATEKQILPAPHSRALSMLHVAMFEAVNAIDRRFTPYKLELTAEKGASKDAAAATAAHAVLVSLFPEDKAKFDQALHASLAAIQEGVAKTQGIELGKTAASGRVATDRPASSAITKASGTWSLPALIASANSSRAASCASRSAAGTSGKSRPSSSGINSSPMRTWK